MWKDSDPLIRGTLLSILVIVIGIALYISLRFQIVVLFLGFLLPIIAFFLVFVFMSLQKKKIQKHLNESFGQNVVKISTSIMEYFELPLTLLLSITMTLFFFAFSLIAVLFWLQIFAS